MHYLDTRLEFTVQHAVSPWLFDSPDEEVYRVSRAIDVTLSTMLRQHATIVADRAGWSEYVFVEEMPHAWDSLKPAGDHLFGSYLVEATAFIYERLPDLTLMDVPSLSILKHYGKPRPIASLDGWFAYAVVTKDEVIIVEPDTPLASV